MDQFREPKKISRKWVQMALILFVAFAILLLLGFQNKIFTYSSFLPLAGFVYLTRRYIHCPVCGRSSGIRVSLIPLLRNKKEIYCPHCGEKIECE